MSELSVSVFTHERFYRYTIGHKQKRTRDAMKNAQQIYRFIFIHCLLIERWLSIIIATKHFNECQIDISKIKHDQVRHIGFTGKKYPLTSS